MKPHPAPSFRFVHPASRFVAGATAAAAALALAALVFGHAADDRAFTFAGVLRPAAVLADASHAPATGRRPAEGARAADRVALAAAR